jgi:PAS domain S-box-containing protein
MQTRWTFYGIVLAGLVTNALALDPNRLPSQYVREQWTTATRFPGGAVNGIAQTADGYLWIGTDRGLIRFDGFNFKPVSFTAIATPSNVSILQLLTDAGGKLWIRPQGADLVRQEDGKFESVRYGPVAITAVSKDNKAGVLVSDIEQGTFRFMAHNVQKLGPSSPPVISMAETADGKVWLGTLGDGLFFLTGGLATNVKAGLPDRKINSLLPIGEELWVGTDTGLYRGDSNGFRRVELPSFLGSVQILSILRDRDSNMWVGTTRGLLRINGKGISFSEENELRGDGGINVLFEDREGNLWVGGAAGLGRIRDSAFITYSSVNDRRFQHNGPVYVDPEGHTWFAPAQGGLYVLQNGRVQPVTSIPANEVVYSISGRADEVWVGRQRGGLTHLRFHNGAIASQSYTKAKGLAQNSAYAVYESRDGSVWAGTLNGGVSKFKDGHFITYTTADGLTSNTVSSILETRDGAMWFATPNGLTSFSNGQWRTYTTIEGLPSPEVNCLFEDSSGTLWSGTSVGLAFFASNRFQVPHESPDVLRKQIVGMAEDKDGRLWIASSNHVLRVPRAKLQSGVVQATDVREYGQADGLESTEGVKRNRSVVSDSAGRIWFSLSRGLSVVNPSQITDNSVPALPHIEAITADNSSATLDASVRIPPSPRRITFEYTGLSLVAPERIRFRYFLENFDTGWGQPVAAREAVYTNLGPGSYRFRLVASNSEGLWNGPETAITLNVAPAYYQTYWFRVSCVGIFIALLWAIHRWRVYRLKSQEKRLRDVVDTIPAIVWSALPDGSNTYVNKRFEEYSGLSAEQTAGSGWQAAVHPDDVARHSAKWVEAVTTGKPHQGEVRFRCSDGQYRWHLDRGVPLRDEDGNIVKWYGVVTDIEDRKRAEEALQQNQFYLSEGQRLAHMGSWAFNPSGFFEYWSEELFKIYGLDPQKGAPALEQYLAIVHPQDRDFMAETIRKMNAARSGCDVKQRIVRRDGELRYIRCVGIPVVEGDVLKGFLGTAIDITEQELLNQELELRQLHLAEAQKLTHTGSWGWRVADRSVVHLSEEWYRIYGFDPAEGAPAWEKALERIHPDDRDRWSDTIERAIRESSHYDLEFRIIWPNGRVKWIHSVGHPVFSAAGDLEQFVGSSTDVTERKHAEEALRSSEAYLVEAQSLTHTGSCAIDGPSRETVYWSDEMFRLFGFDPQQGLPMFDQWLQRIHAEDRDKVKLASDRTFLTKVSCDVEFRVVKPDGTVKHIHGLGHPVLSATGELIQVLGTMVDVTERKRAEEARDRLRQLEDHLAHINRVSTLGEIAASLAHEIKQPIAAAMTSANSCIEWLAHEPPNLDRARAAAAKIDKYGNRAAEIIDRIRSFYKKSPPQRELVDVNGIIQEMLTLLNGEADRYSVVMRTELSAELPKITADRVQLQQVFMNLMVNGIEAMNDSGGELTVKSHRHDGQLQFSVSDTGVGLPTEKMDQIFSAFFTTKPQGSGMGLAISRSIVESHGGRLWATANDARGATFHFTLPTEATETSPFVAEGTDLAPLKGWSKE